MNRMNLHTDELRFPDQEGRGIDQLLRDFFRAEMPNPWPAPPVFTAGAKPQTIKMVRPARKPNPARRYLALAAAVALFFVGYLGLSAIFPEALPGGSVLNSIDKNGLKAPLPPAPAFIIDPNDAFQQNAPKEIQTPNGKVRIWEQHFDNNKMFLRLEAVPKAK